MKDVDILEVSIRELLPHNYSLLSLVYIDNKPVNTTHAQFHSPSSSWDFDYRVRFLARNSHLPHRLLEKALPTEGDLNEKFTILALKDKIHDCDGFLTDLSYGRRLGDTSRPDQVLLSLSDEYIEELSKQLYLLAGPQAPFCAQDLKEARETIGSLTQCLRNDQYFSDEDLALLANAWHHATLKLDPKHLRYPPKIPPKMLLKDEGPYSEFKSDLRECYRGQDPFYQHYKALFLEGIYVWDVLYQGFLRSEFAQSIMDRERVAEMLSVYPNRNPVVKLCPVCSKLFSRPRSEKGHFSQKTYCSERCRKEPEGHRYYQRNKTKLRKAHREYMKTTRAFYASHGLSYDKKHTKS